MLRPDVVLRLSREILAEPTPYRRTRRAVLAALDELRQALHRGALKIPARETRWMGTLQKQADALPEQEEEFIAEMLPSAAATHFLPKEYGLRR